MMPFLLFQSTHPRGVRHETTEGYPYKQIFQSTHPRGVRRIRASSVGDILCISIHAPTWGATPLEVYNSEMWQISIHAPTWGATSNNRFRIGARRISIHAPTWGATRPQASIRAITSISIHAPTWGATLILNLRSSNMFDFNPRTHVGCDPCCWVSRYTDLISIHAPTWGATVKPSNGWLLGHKDNEFANENIIIINSVNIT